MKRADRMALLEPHSAEVSLKDQAALLSLSRSSLYYCPLPPSPEEVAIKHRIDEIYPRWPFYGSRRITVQLNREEIPVSRPPVQRYMRDMGICGIAPGPNTSQPAPEHQIYPYLLRQVTASYPNHVWGIGYHLRAARRGLDVPGGCDRLVLALRGGLGAGSNPGTAVCPECGGAGARASHPNHLEQ